LYSSDPKTYLNLKVSDSGTKSNSRTEASYVVAVVMAFKEGCPPKPLLAPALDEVFGPGITYPPPDVKNIPLLIPRLVALPLLKIPLAPSAP